MLQSVGFVRLVAALLILPKRWLFIFHFQFVHCLSCRSSRVSANGPAIKQVAEGNLPEGRSDRRERSFIACWALLNGA